MLNKGMSSTVAEKERLNTEEEFHTKVTAISVYN